LSENFFVLEYECLFIELLEEIKLFARG